MASSLTALVIVATSVAWTGDEPHWAFVSPTRPPVPNVAPGSANHPIDAFTRDGLAAVGLSPAPEASPEVLIRRLTFDLTGLPPTPDEIDSFLQDRSPIAYERLVDRLLASPRYGERQAQHWLDLARYADSDGFEFDQARPNAYRYRDWVIRAFNADLPYDCFLGLQIAGDEIAPEDPFAHVATGFNRCYPDMVDLNDQGLRRQNALNDITETTGLVFLGLTFGCARCHDHKFDPIGLADFYRLQAFFTPATFRDDHPIGDAGQRARYERDRRQWEEDVTAARSELLRIEQDVSRSLAPGVPAGLDDPTIQALNRPEAQRSPEEVRLVFEAYVKDPRVKDAAIDEALPPDRREQRRQLRTKLARLEKAPPALPSARVLEETSPEAAPTHLLVRGDYGSPGDEVQPALPKSLSAGGALPRLRPTPTTTGRRRALAEWLTRAENPLVARVIVNRIWQTHFGRGIVATPSDFGTMSDPPSHPLLLDWLATELVRDGWSLKALHRRIVTSATYRQDSRPSQRASAEDPENLLVSHQNRRRLDGEAIRDALLAVSGRLNSAMEGPPVFPELPRELTRLSSKGDVWPVSSAAADRQRRSIYVFVRRNLRYPFFEAFDRPDTNASCPRRPVTTIAPQALTLLNGQLAHEAARALAERVRPEAGEDREAMARAAFRLAFARGPDPGELAIARDFLGTNQPDDLVLFCLALLNANEFLYVD
jgi:hypothetical protein